MDGIHDLGGMHGFGPVERETAEPVFHAPWERTVVAIVRTAIGRRLINIDEFRHGIERMEPARYLASTYYARWLDGTSRVLVEKGVVGARELEERAGFFESHPGAAATDALPGPPPPPEPRAAWGPVDTVREETSPPRFKVGDAVVTRNLHPAGHTRLPRYARGKHGVIHRYHGVHVFPDSNAHGLGEQPQPLYSVTFQARELWGDAAEPGQAVHLDLWESYLGPA
jgi:nitrile hydratase